MEGANASSIIFFAKYSNYLVDSKKCCTFADDKKDVVHYNLINTMRHHQKIAIARLISDLIKADDVICKEEIALYNHIVCSFEISQDELYEAQFVSQAEAVAYIKNMLPSEQKKILSILQKAAYSDNSCVAREALLLQSLSLTLNDTSNKYHLLSTLTKGWQNLEKYVVYIESDYMQAINEEIMQQYEMIANLLHLWKFEFIYIPKLTQSFREMDRTYLCDIIRYMNPRLSSEMLNNLYDRLTNFTTESFTHEYLANSSHHNHFYDIEPSLLINVSTSHVPATSPSQQDTYFINFLTIRLEDEPDCVLNEVRRFLDQYETYITEPEYHRPKRGKTLFRYHGFYKQLFDFLARHHTNGEENCIVIDLPARRIWMRGIEVQMSATQLATYVFILHQTLCTHHGGLIKAGQHHPLSEKDVMRLGNTYHSICNLFRDTPIIEQKSYLEDVTNIRGYIARIRTVIAHHIDDQDIRFYTPQDTSDKSRYHIAIEAPKVFLRTASGEVPFVEYTFWKTLK